jgi:hypothetical protein
MAKKRKPQKPNKLSGMDEHDFLGLLKEMGFKSNQTRKNEYQIRTESGELVGSFGVYHQKGTKSFVKPCYVKELWKAYEEIQEEGTAEEEKGEAGEIQDVEEIQEKGGDKK